MSSEKNLKFAFVIVCLSLLGALVQIGNYTYKVQKQKNDIVELKKNVDSLQNLSDSLSMELFPIEIELGRYQVAYQIFMERNPKAASQYGDIISEETE